MFSLTSISFLNKTSKFKVTTHRIPALYTLGGFMLALLMGGFSTQAVGDTLIQKACNSDGLGAILRSGHDASAPIVGLVANQTDVTTHEHYMSRSGVVWFAASVRRPDGGPDATGWISGAYLRRDCSVPHDSVRTWYGEPTFHPESAQALRGLVERRSQIVGRIIAGGVPPASASAGGPDPSFSGSPASSANTNAASGGTEMWRTLIGRIDLAYDDECGDLPQWSGGRAEAPEKLQEVKLMISCVYRAKLRHNDAFFSALQYFAGEITPNGNLRVRERHCPQICAKILGEARFELQDRQLYREFLFRVLDDLEEQLLYALD